MDPNAPTPQRPNAPTPERIRLIGAEARGRPGAGGQAGAALSVGEGIPPISPQRLANARHWGRRDGLGAVHFTRRALE